MKSKTLKTLILIGLLALSATTAMAQNEHVFVPLHWTLGTISGPAGVPVDGRTVVFYREGDLANNLTAVVGQAPTASGNYVINTYNNGNIPINYTDTYYVAVTRGQNDNYGANPASFTFTQGEGYKVVNLTLTDGGGPPSLTGISPDSGAQGQSLAVIINGFNTTWNQNNPPTVSFGNGITVVGNVRVANSTQIVANISIANDANVGPRAVSVIGAVGSAIFNIVAADTPVLSGISPSTGEQGKTLDLVITGANVNWGAEIAAASVHFSGSGITINSASGNGTSITVNVGIASDATLGDRMVTVDEVSGSVIFKVVPAGTVPLAILRESTNIKISWDNTNLDYRNPRIFAFLTGNGTGQFTNVPDGWQEITAANAGNFNFDFTNYANGSVLHTGQVGGGLAEAYYKALRSNVANDQIAAILPTAPAVGKVNVAIYKGLNLISVPFTKDSMILDNVLGNDQLSDGDSLYKMLSPGGGDFFRAYLKLNDGWYDASDNSKIANIPRDDPRYKNIVVNPKYGYFIEAKAAKTLTVFGKVIDRDADVPVSGNGFTILGMLYPKAVPLDASNLINLADPANSAAANDSIYYKALGTDADYLRAYVSGDKIWTDASNDKPITDLDYNANLKTLKVPNAYFFYRFGDGFTWKRKK